MRPARCSRLSLWIFLAAVALAIAACESEPDAGTGEESSPSVAAPGFDCAEEQRLIEDGSLGVGPAVEGDVDGDGSLDDVQVILDEDGEPGCEAFLVVDASERTYSIPIWIQGATGGLPQPSVKALADIDGNPGLEVVVDEAGGASTQFAGVYTMRDGDLSWVELPGSEMGLFAYGGSVGHLEAVDCAGDHAIVVTRAVPGQGNEALEKSLYDVTRTTYQVEDGALDRVSSESDQVPIDRLDSYREFQTSPFGTCSSG